jgi:hypothetical protein
MASSSFDASKFAIGGVRAAWNAHQRGGCVCLGPRQAARLDSGTQLVRLVIEIARVGRGAAYEVLYRSFFEAISQDSAKSAAESLFEIQVSRGANFVKIIDMQGKDLCRWQTGQHSWSKGMASAGTKASHRSGCRRAIQDQAKLG